MDNAAEAAASPPTLLVTRPTDAGRRFAEAAGRAGFATLLAPMLEYAPAPPPPAGRLEAAQAILLTSQAAVAPLASATARRDIPVLTVGRTTAEIARRAGFARVESADGDVRALAALATRRLDPAAGPLAHVGGARRAGDLAGELRSAGFDADTVVIYDVRRASRFPPETVAALREDRVAYAAFFSPQSARVFARLIRSEGMDSLLGGVVAAALSGAVADAADGLGWRGMLIAREPTAAALLSILAASAFGAAPGAGAGQAE